jgi:hypothetical protein
MGGASKDEMIAQMKSAYAKKELPLPERGAMSYMMSKRANFGKSYGQGMAHLMFYFPTTEAAFWGADLPGSPVISHQNDPEPLTVRVRGAYGGMVAWNRRSDEHEVTLKGYRQGCAHVSSSLRVCRQITCRTQLIEGGDNRAARNAKLIQGM